VYPGWGYAYYNGMPAQAVGMQGHGHAQNMYTSTISYVDHPLIMRVCQAGAMPITMAYRRRHWASGMQGQGNAQHIA